eukprot:1258970-Prymnesium_polylepis.1
MLMNASVIQLPIAAAVRAVGEMVKQYYSMLELQFASKQLAIERRRMDAGGSHVRRERDVRQSPEGRCGC